MTRHTLRRRLRYRLDRFLSRGPGVLVLGLFGATLLVVVALGIVVVLLGWATESGLNDLDVVWRAFLTTLDPGTVANFLGERYSAGLMLAFLGATLFGILLTSILIGILVTGLQNRLEELRKGRSIVVEDGHTVILGWSQQIFTIVSELALAAANQRRSSIVVLAGRDKVAMQDEIRAHVGSTGRTRVVCRTGDPIEATDLAIVGLDTAKSVIILPPDVEDPDVDVIKTILAITHAPDRRDIPHHIVAEIRSRDSLMAARIAGRDEARLVVVGDLIARIIAQTCRQSGLSVVYTELLDFEGDEIYEAEPPPELVGRTFRDCLFAYDTSTVIGLLSPDGGTRLRPPMGTIIGEGDRLLAISADDDTVVPAAGRIDVVDETLIVAPRARRPSPERTLVLGWNRRGAAIARELDGYVAPGSRLVIAATDADIASSPMPDGDLRNIVVETRQDDPTRRESLMALCAEGFDHVIVLCSDAVPPQRADARTLVTLLHLRDLVNRDGDAFSITSEMLDLRNRALAEVTRADDFIVSDRLAGLLMSQLSENAHLKGVFDELFDAAGSEICLRPASDYVRTGVALTFATVLESSARRGEIAIGYREAAASGDARRAYGVVINPPKTRSLTFEPDDKVIVLAEGD
ncbi:MAG: potassium transporter TrkA [Chloroflexota bacterium]